MIATAWGLAGFLVFVTLCPQNLRPHFGDAQVERFGAYFATAAAFVLAYPRRTIVVAVAAVALATLLELSQWLAPGRDPGVLDVIAKAFGGLTGALITGLIVRLARAAGAST